MSSYIKLSTLEYPRHEGDIRSEYPEITVDQTGATFPCPDTYALVEETPIPEVTDTQTFAELAPVCIDGVWRRVWSVTELTSEELAYRAELKDKLLVREY
jgi:hypothetical protein